MDDKTQEASNLLGLTEEQTTRAIALGLAKEALTGKNTTMIGGAFRSIGRPKTYVLDLLDVAEYIVSGIRVAVVEFGESEQLVAEESEEEPAFANGSFTIPNGSLIGEGF